MKSLENIGSHFWSDLFLYRSLFFAVGEYNYKTMNSKAKAECEKGISLLLLHKVGVTRFRYDFGKDTLTFSASLHKSNAVSRKIAWEIRLVMRA